MPRFKRFDVVSVPFPYTDRPVRQRRPALVLSSDDLERAHGLLWVAMITAAENRRWQDDVEIGNLRRAGLPIASVIRPSKVATIEADHAEHRGEVGGEERAAVEAVLERYLS